MQNENEIVMMILCFFALLFIIFYWKTLRKVSGFNLLFYSFIIFLTACIATNLERQILGKFLNIAEHIGYMISVMLLCVWVYKHFSLANK
ncbi:MAG: hypothetical protein JW894_01985 [Bacteroidales bacterium]|nr:hypothetical protein [Bacteroidales bacterium]